MGMTERPSEPKPAPSDAASDPTTADTTLLYTQAKDPRAFDAEPRAFDPGKFSEIVISPAMRQEMLKAKPPRLGPEFFRDTMPPHRPLAAPAGVAGAVPLPAIAKPDAEEAEPIPGLAKPRAPTRLVIVCLLGVALLLVLAIVRWSSSDPEPMRATDPEVLPTAIGSAEHTPLAPMPPSAEAASKPSDPAAAPAPPVQTPVQKNTSEHKSSERPPPDRSTASKPPRSSASPEVPPIPSVATAPASPPLSATPSSAPPPSSTPSPVQSNWFDYK